MMPRLPTAFTKAGLTTLGFTGWVSWAALAETRLPIEPGVYAVVHEPEFHPVFLPTSVAGFRREDDPSVCVETLERKWVPDASVLYIGTATSLTKRVHAYRKHGEGKNSGHWGGRYLWQYAGWPRTMVGWKVTDGDPVGEESRLLDEFEAQFGRLPFANLVRGKRR